MDTTAIAWLQAHTELADLSAESLAAIAAVMTEQVIPENRRISLENTPPDAVYILRSGYLEQYRTQPDTVAEAVGLLPGAIVNLRDVLLDQPTTYTVITLSDVVLWRVTRADVLALVQRFPELPSLFSRRLASELTQVTAQLTYERDRQAALLPYRVTQVQRGIVGKSRYAQRQRQDIRNAQGDRGSVLVFGEPGLGKDNTAALIHFGSRDRHEPLIKLNCDSLQANGMDLFGRAGGKPGLLDWLGRGSLLLNNIQDTPPELQDKLLHLLRTGDYTPVPSPETPTPPPRHSPARILMTSERILPSLEPKGIVTHLIKVAPLRVRKADIQAQVDYYLSLLCRQRRINKPRLTPEALRRLQGYDFPGNLTELDSLVKRAVIQLNGATELTEEVFWAVSPKGRRFRVNLLNAYPGLRQFLRSPWFPDRLNYGIVAPIFALVVLVLFLGPQSRDRNIALNLFWAWWWLGILVAFPFVGRLWCAVCPFMIYGEIAQKLSLQLFPRPLLPWSRQAADRWGGWYLVGLFSLILLWEELWNLENTAYLSACLLLLITAGAVIFSLLFERRFWCRYLCPIGGMNGMFAKLSMVELRAQQGICSASCTTYQCYKGGVAKGEGQETAGCPLYSHPAQLTDNRDCVLCMTCLKACPHRSVEVNLRPPGIELWTTHVPRPSEVALLFLLLGAALLHRLPEVEMTVQRSLHLDQFGIHAGVAIAALAAPGAIAYGSDQLMRRLQPSVNVRSFVELAYGYLPLVLGANLAHYLRLGLTEAGRVLPVTAATFGWDHLSWGTATVSTATLPVAIAHPAVIAFLQAVTLIVSVWLSIFLTQKIARQPWQNLLPQHLALFGMGCVFWWVMVGW